MFRRNWGFIAASVGLTVTVFGSGIGVYYLDNPQAGQASARKDHKPPQNVTIPAHPDERIASALETIQRDQNSSENVERERRDLDAQEGAWRWTKWSAWVAFVQLVLSGVGIAFVVASLRQGQAGLKAARRALWHARKANDIAREANENQIRPWLSVVITNAPRMDMVNGLPRIKVKLRIENKGESPAVNISYAVLLCVGYEPTIGYHINWSQYRKDYLGFVGDIFQGEATELDAEVHHDGKRLGCERGYLVATVFYKATFSDELRETSVFWKMWDNRSDEDLIDFGEPLSSKQLVLTPWNEMPGLIG